LLAHQLFARYQLQLLAVLPGRSQALAGWPLANPRLQELWQLAALLAVVVTMSDN